MNYRHSFHAGNFADVHKHWVLTLVLARLLMKDKPFFVLDSHAGAGFYDLDRSEAGRTGEAAEGIGRLLTEPPAGFEAYLSAIATADPGGSGRFYPGSPWLIAKALRSGDRLAAVEAHPDQARLLSETLAEFPNARVFARDGYREIPSHLPPKERRGLILIDPPFEQRDEVARIAKAVTDGLKRFETGIFLIWYPIKTHAIGDALAALLPKDRPGLRSEIWITAPDREDSGLTGSGLMILNPPYTLEDSLKSGLPVLTQRLARDAGADYRLQAL